jgi:hypothetical protein
MDILIGTSVNAAQEWKGKECRMRIAIGVWGERDVCGTSGPISCTCPACARRSWQQMQRIKATLRRDAYSRPSLKKFTIQGYHRSTSWCSGRRRRSVDVSQAMLQVEKDKPSTQVTAAEYPLSNYKFMLCISRACIWAPDQG